MTSIIFYKNYFQSEQLGSVEKYTYFKSFNFFVVEDQITDKKKSRTDQYLDLYHF